MEEESENMITLVSQVTELNDLSEFMQEPDIDKAMEKILNLVSKPNVPGHLVPPLIVWCQALSSKFHLQAKHHMLFRDGKNEEVRKRKSAFMSMAEDLEKISHALKYLVK